MRWQTRKQKKELLEAGIELFNNKPKKGMKVLQANEFVGPEPADVARFLLDEARLDPAAVCCLSCCCCHLSPPYISLPLSSAHTRAHTQTHTFSASFHCADASAAVFFSSYCWFGLCFLMCNPCLDHHQPADRLESILGMGMRFASLPCTNTSTSQTLQPPVTLSPA